MATRKSQTPKERSSALPRIVLRGLGPQAERPKIAVYALDAQSKVIETARVDEEGQYDLSTGAVRKAYIVQLAPDGARIVTDSGTQPCDDPHRQYPILMGGKPA